MADGISKSGSRDEKDLLFSRYRSYLRILAGTLLGNRLGPRLDASDLVQETLLKAWRDRGQFRGATDREYAAWLRAILARTACNAARDNRRQRKDVGRERAIEARLHESSVRIESWLAAEGPSPSEEFGRAEALEMLSAALDELPESQRTAVTLRHWQGLTLKEIAARMEKTTGAVALLIHRGVSQIRERLRAGGCGARSSPP